MPKRLGIAHERAIRAFEKRGFRVVRQRKHTQNRGGASHHHSLHSRANPINAFTTGGIIRDAGMTVEEFKELL